MNGIHDFGGMQNFGPIPIDPKEPKFSADWEKRSFALTILPIMAGLFNPDEHRYSTERIPTLRYLASSYYLRWLDATERLLNEKGVMQDGKAVEEPSAETLELLARAKAVPVERVQELARGRGSASVEKSAARLFAVGDLVRAKNWNPQTHTRLPRYVRGRTGKISAVRDAFVYADTRAHLQGDQPQFVYTVRFEGRELWGPDGHRRDAVYIDLYEDYLERV